MTVDADGIVLSHNEQASVALPGVAVGLPLAAAAPAWLVEAHLRHTGDGGSPSVWAGGRLGGRRVNALAGPGSNGTVTWWLVGDHAPAAVARELARERARAGLLQELSSELLASMNVERCMRATVRRAARNLADAAVIVGPGDDTGHPVTRCTADGPVVQEHIALDPEQLPGLAEALSGLPTVSSRWIDPRQLPPWAVPDEFVDAADGIGSVAVVPLPGHGAPVGCLVLLRRRRAATFTPGEESFAQLFAARAGAALSIARGHARQAHLTDVLMRDLLPPELGRVHGIGFSARYRASVAGERVGGDFYDLYPADTPETETVVVLGDVCGKGLEAAVTARGTRSALRALVPFAADHTRLLTLLNSALLASEQPAFVTLALATVVREDAHVRLRLSSAGHPAPLIVRTTGRIETVRAPGTLLGAFPDTEFDTAEVTLRPGETCLLFTDGITEARGGPLGTVMFGENRLRTVLSQCAGMPPEVVTERVQMVVAQWVGDRRHDDMAVLAIGAPHDKRPATDRQP
ncbi:GAF domain-containing SpoIIE family protein phosphatase [Streptomyces sp. NPDC046939]|uniref:PP2C family protein-serine/threonine phosphatase n=1 Tax=Streptomyces sp. NPDC046939 TaxID=3155376 RepID=UPI0034076DDC